MKRNRWMWMAALVLPVSAAMGVEPGHFFNQLEEGTSQQATAVRLQQKVSAVKLERASLQTVLRQIETGTGLRIAADWAALAKTGVKPTSLVTLIGKDVAYTTYFETIAKQLHAGIGIYLQADGAIGFTASNAVPARDSAARGVSAFRSLVPARVSVESRRAQQAPKLAKDSLTANPDRLARTALDNTVREIQFKDVGLERAIESLRASCPCNFVVNWAVLEAAGISKDTPVSVNLARVPVRAALATILAQAGGGGARLNYAMHDDIVTVSTQDDLDMHFREVQVYDIRDFLAGRGGRDRDDMVRDIVDTIKTIVAPETWRDAGGDLGSVRELNGQLIVQQNHDNNVAVGKLLQQLRERPLARPRR